ncbi:hypothetical protein [Levilactobacillus yiduensis]|uniref:hypothetical protein n=1 Tax=Levilactobacillus yiduensis TaxID=2953880 RepID=UPI00215789D6|nr:hypothetical protein [Levilactobacillus yiduensis]
MVKPDDYDRPGSAYSGGHLDDLRRNFTFSETVCDLYLTNVANTTVSALLQHGYYRIVWPITTVAVSSLDMSSAVGVFLAVGFTG